ncbi:MAG: bis-aminopropyl spermidine synthase family protein, partial [bacterium]
ILILGDDDLVSIALMLTGKPSRIVVLEIDDRLTDFISRNARILGFSALEVRKSDLRHPLTEDLIGKFDVFETDPTESYSGFRLFLTRGAVSLRGLRCAGYFGLTRLESSLWKWRKMQQFLLRAGFVFTAIFPDFHSYEHWDYHPFTRAGKLVADPVPENFRWYTSALVRVEKIAEVALPNLPLKQTGPKFYRDEESSTS